MDAVLEEKEETSVSESHQTVSRKPSKTKSETGAWKKARRFCHIDPNLISLKLMMLLLYGGMTALYPFLTVHMRSIGLTITDTAIIYSLLPFVSCMGPPLFGALADKIGNYKIILIFVIFVSNVFHLLMCFVIPPVVPGVAHTEISLTRLNASFPCQDSSIAGIEISSSQMGNLASCQMPPYERLLFDQRRPAVFEFCALKCNDTFQTEKEICVSYRECLSLGDDLSRRYRTVKRYMTTPSPNNRTDQVAENCRKVEESELCSLYCEVRTDTTVSCIEADTSFSARMTTFVMYTVFRLIATSTIYTGFSILDSAAYQMAEQHQGDLGIQRMFSLIGICVFPPVSGFLVGLASDKAGSPDYTPAFFIYCSAHGLAMVISIFMKIDIRKTSDNIWQNVGKLLRNPRIFGFVAMAFLAGCAWGFLENYLFLFMEDIGSPKWLLGMTNTVSALSAIPVIAASTIIVKVVGHTNLIIICVMLYGCRFLAYSFIYNPYLVLPVEVLEAFTTSLLWVVISVYCGKIAPEYLATMQGVSASAHNALGRGVGALVGGVVFARYGARTTYHIFGGTFLGIGVVYFAIFYAYLRDLPYGDEDNGSPSIVVTDHDDEEADAMTPEEEAQAMQFAKIDMFTRRFSYGAPLVAAAQRESAANTLDIKRASPSPAHSPRQPRRASMVPRRARGSIANGSTAPSVTSRRGSSAPSRRGSELSEEDKEYLARFARNAALTRRYSMVPVLTRREEPNTDDEAMEEALRGGAANRRSSLRVTFANLG